MELFDLPYILRWLATSWLGRAFALGFTVAVLGAVFLDWSEGVPIVAGIVTWIAGTLGAAAGEAKRQNPPG